MWSCRGGDKKKLLIQHKVSGNEVNAQVRTIQDGGMVFGPLTGEFLHVAEKEPQVSYTMLKIIWVGFFILFF